MYAAVNNVFVPIRESYMMMPVRGLRLKSISSESSLD